VLEVDFMGERRTVITTPDHVKPLNLEAFMKERVPSEPVIQSQGE